MLFFLREEKVLRVRGFLPLPFSPFPRFRPEVRGRGSGSGGQFFFFPPPGRCVIFFFFLSTLFAPFPGHFFHIECSARNALRGSPFLHSKLRFHETRGLSVFFFPWTLRCSFPGCTASTCCSFFPFSLFFFLPW